MLAIQLAVVVAILLPARSQYISYHNPQNIDQIWVYGNCEIRSSTTRAEARVHLYEEHNRARSGRALGIRMFYNKDPDPVLLMKGLVYHCDAEKVAEQLLLDNQAESHRVTSDFKYFVNYYGTFTQPMKPMELVKKAMEEWLNNTSSFNRIVYQTSGYMGCAYRLTRREKFEYSEVACVYSRRLFEQWIRKPSGPNCIRDSDCDQFGRYLICLGRYGLCMDQPTRVYSYPFKKYLK